MHQVFFFLLGQSFSCMKKNFSFTLCLNEKKTLFLTHDPNSFHFLTNPGFTTCEKFHNLISELASCSSLSKNELFNGPSIYINIYDDNSHKSTLLSQQQRQTRASTNDNHQQTISPTIKIENVNVKLIL